MAIEGNILVVGAPGDSTDFNDNNPYLGKGAVYIYEKVGGAWQIIQKLTALDRETRPNQARFGSSVDINNGVIAIGSDFDSINGNLRSGSAYIFNQITPNNWAQSQKLIPSSIVYEGNFGGSIGIQGNNVLIGAPSDANGKVYAFNYNGASWNETQQIESSYSPTIFTLHYGDGIDMDGTRAIIGSSDNSTGPTAYHGEAYVLDFNGSSWVESQRILPGTIQAYGAFARTVSIDGDFLSISHGGDDFDEMEANPIAGAGSTSIYKFNGSSWVLYDKILAPTRQIGMGFGFAVALVNDLLVVGAVGDNLDENEMNPISGAGAVYSFFLNDELEWEYGKKIVANQRYDGDSFGQYMTLTETDLFIYSDTDYDEIENTPLDNAGAIYYFYNCPFADITEFGTACLYEATELDAKTSGGSWSGSYVSTSTFTPTNTGNTTINYSITKYGCTQNDDYEVFVNPLPNVSANSTLNSLCENDTVSLYGTGAHEYSWDLGVDNNVSFSSPVGTTVYTVTGTDTVTGCINTDNIGLNVQENPQPTISLNGGLLSCDIGGASFQWLLNGAPIGGANSQNFTPVINGTYTILVTANPNSCTGESNPIVVMSVGVNELTEENTLVFPNPTNGEVFITLADINDYQISVTTVTGKQVYFVDSFREKQLRLSLNEYAKGVYFVKIKTKSTQKVIKVIKK